MDSNGEFIYNEFFNSSSSERADDDYKLLLLLMMMSILKAMEKEEGHVLNFKSLTTGRIIVSRNKAKGHVDLYNDYFKANRIYHEGFLSVLLPDAQACVLAHGGGCERNDSYFTMKNGCTRVIVCSPLQKCVAAMRILAYATATNAIDEYVRIVESTCIESDLPPHW